MEGKAAAYWREKLHFFQEELARTADPGTKFALFKLIAEAEEMLAGQGSAAPAGGAPPARPPRLPRVPRCFGREREIEALVAALCGEPPSPTPLLGGPGMGKSTISFAALEEMRVVARFGPRRYFVRCDAAESGETMVRALASGVGLDLEAGGDPAGRVFQELERAPAALALDNLETPWWSDPGPVEDLLAQLAGVPGLALAVSLRGGRRPLKIAWGKTIEVGVLPLAAARQTFLAIAGEHLAGDPHLDGLLEAVDRVAIAVELLAHQAEDEPNLAGLQRRWERERTRLLRMGESAGRQLDLGASLELSVQSPRMTPAARRLLALLGRLPDGIALADLPALLEDGDAAAGCLRQVGLAAGRSDQRLQLLAPVREHAAHHYEPEATDLSRTIAHYLRLAAFGERAGREGGAEAVARLSPELNNLESLITRELERTDPRPAIRAVISLGRLFRLSGLGGTGLVERARGVAERIGDVQSDADCLMSLGDTAHDRSRLAEARSRYQQALLLYRGLGDLASETECIKRLGDVAVARFEHGEAHGCYEQVLPVYRRLGNLIGEANCIKSLGDVAVARFEHDEAHGRYEQALPVYRRAGDKIGEANCIRRLGDIAWHRGENAAAGRCYEQALAIYRSVGSLQGEANCIWRLGDLALDAAARGEARSRYDLALAIYRRIGDVRGEANCLQRLADIARVCGEPAEARGRVRQALALFQRAGDLLEEANCLLSLGEMEENAAEAQRLSEAALVLYGRIPEPHLRVLAHTRLARWAGDPAERRRHLVAALNFSRQLGDPDLASPLRQDIGDGERGLPKTGGLTEAVHRPDATPG